MSYFNYITNDMVEDTNVKNINDQNIGQIVTYSMFMIAQTHIWHLLCPNGQKHTALQEFYEGLQDEVDEMAERFIALGGILVPVDEPIVAEYNDDMVKEKMTMFRNLVTSGISQDPNIASVVDGVIDIQQLIDNTMYKFNLQ